MKKKQIINKLIMGKDLFQVLDFLYFLEEKEHITKEESQQHFNCWAFFN